MLVEDGRNRPRRVNVDPANMARQKADLERRGYTVNILDEDELIYFGLLAQQLRKSRA